MGIFKRIYREIEAVRFDGSNCQELWDAFGKDGIVCETHPHAGGSNVVVMITTPGYGEMQVKVGDWIISFPEPGTFFPIPDDLFRQMYTEIEEDANAGSRSSSLHPGSF